VRWDGPTRLGHSVWGLSGKLPQLSGEGTRRGVWLVAFADLRVTVKKPGNAARRHACCRKSHSFIYLLRRFPLGVVAAGAGAASRMGAADTQVRQQES